MKNIINFKDLWDNFSDNLHGKNILDMWIYPSGEFYNDLLFYTYKNENNRISHSYVGIGREDLFQIKNLIEELKDKEIKPRFDIQTNNKIGPFIVLIVDGLYLHKRVRRVLVDEPAKRLQYSTKEIWKKEIIYFITPNLSMVTDWLLYWANDIDQSSVGFTSAEKKDINKILSDINNSL